MTENEKILLELLRKRSIRRGVFRLTSGILSNLYVDVRTTSVSSEGAYLIGEVLYERIKDVGVDAVGGLQVGAVPLITAVVISSYRRGRLMEGFWVREGDKPHGTRKRVEGGIREGARVAIVDDVITKGGSALEAVKAVRDLGHEVVMALALVDRLRGGEELLRKNGVENYQAVFTARDFGGVLAEAFGKGSDPC